MGNLKFSKGKSESTEFYFHVFVLGEEKYVLELLCELPKENCQNSLKIKFWPPSYLCSQVCLFSKLMSHPRFNTAMIPPAILFFVLSVTKVITK